MQLNRIARGKFSEITETNRLPVSEFATDKSLYGVTAVT